MTVELTGSFTYLLPVVLAVAVSILLGRVLRTEPLYERLLEDFMEEEGARTEKLTVKVRVGVAAGNSIRDILWPQSAFVTSVMRGEEVIPAGGGTALMAGDILTVEGTPQERSEYLTALRDAVGEIVAVDTTENSPPMSETDASS